MRMLVKVGDPGGEKKSGKGCIGWPTSVVAVSQEAFWQLGACGSL